MFNDKPHVSVVYTLKGSDVQMMVSCYINSDSRGVQSALNKNTNTVYTISNNRLAICNLSFRRNSNQ